MCSSFAYAQELVYAIIPLPQSIVYQTNTIKFTKQLSVTDISGQFKNEVNWLIKHGKQQTGIDYTSSNQFKGSKNNAAITLTHDSKLSDEAYEVLVNEKGIQLKAGYNKGMFYAMQTLLQMVNSTSNLTFRYVHIQDQPTLKWRGMHLDVSRHFFSVQEVKSYIDYLAMYKLNVFHWHLTDDQGWRMEIKRFPNLTHVGAWRNGSMVGRYSDHRFDSIRYGGFYTQQEIKEVVAYATERHVNVVPEIEMPGHALAALTAYPQYSCTGGPFAVSQMWGVFDDVFCAGNDSTFLFLQAILDEVMELFPSNIIHIGGDECPKTRWKVCGKCQSRIQQLGLKNEHELQSYFIQRIEKYLNSKGRKIIGWDEILEGGLAPNAAVMSWRGREGGIAAAQLKHDAVMTPGKPCYFDHYQNPETTIEPIAIGGLNTLQDVYTYIPIPEELSEEERTYILGAQANVWTEYMTSFSQVQYMALPRMAALSETLWSNSTPKDYTQFIQRLTVQVKQLDRLNVNYCKLFLSKP